MPVVNAAGSVIYERQDPKPYLRHLKLPDHAEVICHLSPADFIDWLYGLEPVEALLQSPEIQVISIERKKHIFRRLTDWVWRWKHGIDY